MHPLAFSQMTVMTLCTIVFYCYSSATIIMDIFSFTKYRDVAIGSARNATPPKFGLLNLQHINNATQRCITNKA